jgi:hypothetical protein
MKVGQSPPPTARRVGRAQGRAARGGHVVVGALTIARGLRSGVGVGPPPPLCHERSVAFLACRPIARPPPQILNFHIHVWIVRAKIFGKNSIPHHAHTPIHPQLSHHGNPQSIFSSNFYHICHWEETSVSTKFINITMPQLAFN